MGGKATFIIGYAMGTRSFLLGAHGSVSSGMIARTNGIYSTGAAVIVITEIPSTYDLFASNSSR
jgi:hypothetical protein